jgi:integrase
MSVYRPAPGQTWRYDFRWRKQRYRGTTGQLRREDAVLYESAYKLRIRQAAGGVAPLEARRTPRFQDWAEVYYGQASKRVGRPDRVEHLVRVVLRFWGAAPEDPALREPRAPYHDLHLADPVVDPAWILRFEDWMAARRVHGRPIAGQTRNQYRSTLSQMYRLGLAPAWRQRTGLTFNPFVGVARDRDVARTVTLTVEELQRWLAAASYHVRLAVAIAALAPKLRLANVLGLQWSQHVDAGLRWITVWQHKTSAATGKPLVVPIVEQLRQILEDARRRAPGDHIVTYHGRPVTSIRNGLQAAAERAGLAYGRGGQGITFHTIRHTAATLLAEQSGLEEAMRKELMGHADLQTTQRYTHLRPLTQVAPLEALSAQLPIADLVTDGRRRAGRTLLGTFGAAKKTGTDDARGR